jgi:hypothetical protein
MMEKVNKLILVILLSLFLLLSSVSGCKSISLVENDGDTGTTMEVEIDREVLIQEISRLAIKVYFLQHDSEGMDIRDALKIVVKEELLSPGMVDELIGYLEYALGRKIVL